MSLRATALRIASELPVGDPTRRKLLAALAKRALKTPRWRAVWLNASTLGAAQGVKFMYTTPSGFRGFEAHRYIDPAEGWAGHITLTGKFNGRKAQGYTDAQILRLFAKGGMLGGEEGGADQAYVTETAIWG